MEPIPGDLAPRLREALTAAGLTATAVAARLGAVGADALARGETTPAFRATRGGDPLDTLVRLWLLQGDVDAAAVERALPGLLGPLSAAGLVEATADGVRARLDLRPYAVEGREGWLLSDPVPGLDGAGYRLAADHVLGASGASGTLAGLVVPGRVGRALDLGTGCGVLALHLAARATEVLATDVNPRALALTGFNAALNDVVVEVRKGSLFDPVAGEAFGLLVSNPPFVVTPGSGSGLVFRDSPMPGDEMVRSVVTGAARHLAPDGWAQVLGGWLHRAGRPWTERVGGWLEGAGCDAWVVQREVLDPAAYVEHWLKDAGRHPATGTVSRERYCKQYDEWLAWFAEHGVDAVGLGWVALRRTGREPATVRIEEWPHPVEQPLGPEVAAWGRRTAALAEATDAAVWGTRWLARDDVRQESLGAPGAEDPDALVLRQQRGLRRARRVDTVEAALVGACDGELGAGQILDAVADLLGRDPPALRAAYLPAVRSLVAEGFLVPPEG